VQNTPESLSWVNRYLIIKKITCLHTVVFFSSFFHLTKKIFFLYNICMFTHTHKYTCAYTFTHIYTTDYVYTRTCYISNVLGDLRLREYIWDPDRPGTFGSGDRSYLLGDLRLGVHITQLLSAPPVDGRNLAVWCWRPVCVCMYAWVCADVRVRMERDLAVCCWGPICVCVLMYEACMYAEGLKVWIYASLACMCVYVCMYVCICMYVCVLKVCVHVFMYVYVCG
jgi:hypothetical protein